MFGLDSFSPSGVQEVCAEIAGVSDAREAAQARMNSAWKDGKFRRFASCFTW